MGHTRAASGAVAIRSRVMTTAEVKHQAHVAPMTKGSRKVRYTENRVPKRAAAHSKSRAFPPTPSGPDRAMIQRMNMAV